MCAVLGRIAQRRIIQAMKNPFKYGCVVGGDSFCERPELERKLAGFVRGIAHVPELEDIERLLVFADAHLLEENGAADIDERCQADGGVKG